MKIKILEKLKRFFKEKPNRDDEMMQIFYDGVLNPPAGNVTTTTNPNTNTSTAFNGGNVTIITPTPSYSIPAYYSTKKYLILKQLTKWHLYRDKLNRTTFRCCEVALSEGKRAILFWDINKVPASEITIHYSINLKLLKEKLATKFEYIAASSEEEFDRFINKDVYLIEDSGELIEQENTFTI